MSFLSDLFEGNFSNLGTDISHAPESAVQDYRSEWVPAAAIGGALLTGGLLAPELLGGAALGEAAGVGAAEGAAGGTLAAEASAPLAFGSAADVGASTLPADLTTTFGEFSPEAFAANTADVAAGGLGTDIAAGDLAAGAGAAIDPVTGLSATPLDPSLSATVIDPATGAPVAGGWGDPTLYPDIAQSYDFAPSYGAQYTDESIAPFVQSGDMTATIPGNADLTATVQGPAGTTAAPASTGWTPSAAETPGITGQTGLSQANSMFGTFQPETSWFGPGSVTGLSGWQAAGLGLAAAPLALALLRGETSIPPQATQAQANANTLSAFGQQQLAAGMSGQLNSGQLAMVNQLGQNELNSYRQTLYNMGVKDPTRDTRYAQMQAKVAQDQAVLTQSLLQQDIQNGLTALGSSSQTLLGVAQMQMSADQQFTNNLVNATTALGRVAGSGMMNFAGGPGTKTTTTTTVQQAA